MKSIFFFLLLLSMSFGCATTPTSVKVAPGAKVVVDYTCRLSSSLVVTSKPEIAQKAKPAENPLFLAHQSYAAAQVTAMERLAPLDPLTPLTLHDEVLNQLAVSIVGLQPKQPHHVRIQGRVPANLPQAERYLSLTRASTRPKQLLFKEEQFMRQTGQKALVGVELPEQQGFFGKVTAIEDGQVQVRIAARLGQIMDSEYGKMIIHERGDHYEVEVLPEIGRVVRAGPLLGRVAQSDEKMFTLDFGHPFGGETLACDIEVASFTPASPAAVAGGTNSRDGSVIHAGDAVRVAYTVRTQTGSLVGTTRFEDLLEGAAAAEASNDAPKSSSDLQAPEIVIAGTPGAAIPGLAEAVVGMSTGQRKRIVVPAQEAYGMPDPSQKALFPRSKQIPRSTSMSPAQFRQRFAADPVLDQEVELTPYFKAKVTQLDAGVITVQALARHGDRIEDTFGSADITVENEMIRIHLNPVIGAAFNAGDRQGRIVAFDDRSFTVDFNHPLAGQSLSIDLQILKSSPVADLRQNELPWINDHEKGLSEAEKSNKPVVLMLYAEWCTWCHKMFDEVFPDGRVQLLKEDFVWVKIDSDKELDLKELYGQKGFPEVVVLDTKGEVLAKLEGFKDGAQLSRALSRFIN